MIERKLILDENAKVELKLHSLINPNKLRNKSELDELRKQLANATIHDLKAFKKVKLQFFLKARCCTSSTDKKPVPSSLALGKNTIDAVMTKLAANTNYTPTKTEDSLFIRSYQLVAVKNLKLKVEEVTSDAKARAAAVPFPARRVDAVFSDHSFISDEILGRNAFQSFGGLSYFNGTTWDSEDSIRHLKAKRDSLLSIIASRLGVFKTHSLKDKSTLCNHYALVAFKDNVNAMVEVLALFDMIPSYLNGIPYSQSLLKPQVTRQYADALDAVINSKSGVMIAFHGDSGSFVDVIRAEGDVTFEAACTKLESKSMDLSSTSNIRRY